MCSATCKLACPKSLGPNSYVKFFCRISTGYSNGSSSTETLAAAWHGGLDDAPEEMVQNATVHDAISLAMNWWFDRDFTNPSCLYDGGTTACPCDANEQHMYNTNWFSNVRLQVMLPSLGLTRISLS
jgi:hypothetical protein